MAFLGHLVATGHAQDYALRLRHDVGDVPRLHVAAGILRPCHNGGVLHRLIEASDDEEDLVGSGQAVALKGELKIVRTEQAVPLPTQVRRLTTPSVRRLGP